MCCHTPSSLLNLNILGTAHVTVPLGRSLYEKVQKNMLITHTHVSIRIRITAQAENKAHLELNANVNLKDSSLMPVQPQV